MLYAGYDRGYKSGGYNLDRAGFDSVLLGGNGAQRFEPRRRTRPAQGELEPAGVFQPGGAVIALARQRMGQKCYQRHRGGLFGKDISEQQQHPPGGGLRQRPAGGRRASQ